VPVDHSIVVLLPLSSPWTHPVISYLHRSGFRLHLIDFNQAPDTNPALATASLEIHGRSAASIDVLRTPGSFPKRVMLNAWKLRSLARRYRAEAVLTLYAGMQAGIACLSGVRPYSVYVVGSDVLMIDGPNRRLTGMFLRRAAAVLSNGAYLARQTQALAPGVAVEPLYLGIDLQRFSPAAGVPRAPRFVCTRVFRPLYDNAAIVRAVAELPAVPPDFHCTFLSSGPLLAETSGLADTLLGAERRSQVTFAGGVDDDALLAALRGATFYLSASHSDGASASLLEAMACGLFPIVSDIPANREWITPGTNGLLFPPGDHHALAGAIAAALGGLAWQAAAVEANHRMLAERADMEVNLQRLSEIVRRQCESARPGRVA
jgi:glycosyltransferase involved in cell wall biosynthesis